MVIDQVLLLILILNKQKQHIIIKLKFNRMDVYF